MILLLLFCLFIALITPSGSTTTVTFSGRYLPRSVKRKVFAVDWMECRQACHSEPGCISCIYHKDEKVCEMNSNGEREGCGGKRTIFHQITPAPKKPVKYELGDDQTNPADSCQKIFDNRRIRVDGSFFIRAKSPSRYAHVFCHMTPIPGCGDGGWTLIMKIDGNKQTFTYDSAYWSNTDTYNEGAGTSLKEEETKLSSFWSTPFGRLCLGMKDALGKTSWISLKHNASSLRDVISDGTHRATNLTVTEWKSLLNNSKIDEGCTLQGFNTNIPSQPASGKARIGIIGFPEKINCGAGSASSRIGFGTGGTWYDMEPSNSCGNEWKNDISKKAFGYIFVQ